MVAVEGVKIKGGVMIMAVVEVAAVGRKAASIT